MDMEKRKSRYQIAVSVKHNGKTLRSWYGENGTMGARDNAKVWQAWKPTMKQADKLRETYGASTSIEIWECYEDATSNIVYTK